jgi:biotin carboxyl carrier protein
VAEVRDASGPVRVTSSPATARPGDDAIVVAPAEDKSPRRRARAATVGPLDPDGCRLVEVVVDGWRFEFLVEDDARAALRERASRDHDHGATGGDTLEIRAIIPGRIASVAVAPGDTVEAGQTLLAVEAMKMQNELRAPRGGTVVSVPATAGATVELGDVLVVLE